MVVLDGLRMVFGAIFILFMPGFAWSFIFFFRREIDWVQRIALSVGLSIAIVPLTVFWLNWLFDVRITLLNTSLTVCVVTALPVAYLLARHQSLRDDVVRKIRGLLRRHGGRQVSDKG